MNPSLVAFLVYLVGMVVAGVVAARFTKTIEDFGLGGRKLGFWVIALSQKSTDMSTCSHPIAIVERMAVSYLESYVLCLFL